MPRDQRYVPPGSLLEITTRTFQGRLLLPPTEEVRDAVLGVLGFALSLFSQVELHGFICLTTHYHMLISVPDPETLARFMSFFNGNVARKVSKIIGWTGAFWSRRYADIPILDELAAVKRLDYLLRNSCKEGLVSSPLAWPGATTARALVLGETVRGKWVNETELSAARRRWKRAHREDYEPEPDPAEFTTWFTIKLAPLPCWKDKGDAERRSLCRAIIERIEESMKGVSVMGVERLRAQNPLQEPRGKYPRRSPEPRCHSSTPEGWRAYVHEHRELRDIYRSVSARIRAGEVSVPELPAWTLPPPRHFTPSRNIRPVTWEAVQAAAAN